MSINLIFRDTKHKQRFFIAVYENSKIFENKIDQEYGAALYVLTSSLSTWRKAQNYIDQDSIHFDDLLKNVDFSHAYSALIKLAGNLFNAKTELSPVDLMGLDENNYHLAINALHIRRNGLHTDDFQDVIESIASGIIESM